MAATESKFNAGALLEGGSDIIGGFQSIFNANIQKRMAGLQAAEARTQKSQFLQNSIVEKSFLIKNQVTRRGQQAGGFAKGGVRIGSGSALNFLVQQARTDRFNQARFDFGVATQARDFEIQAQQADFQRKVAKIQKTVGAIRTGVSVATTATKAFAAGG